MRFHAGRNAPNRKPGWIRKGKGMAYTVKLDGRLVHDVVAADEEDGEVWVRPTPVVPGVLPLRLLGKVEITEDLDAFHDEARQPDSKGITP